MRLFLEDFSKKEEDTQQTDTQREYIDRIADLEREIRNLKTILEEEKKTAFEEGYRKGIEDGFEKSKEEFEKKLIELEDRAKKQTKDTLEQYLSKIDENLDYIKKKYKSVLDGTIEIISDSIEEIIEFLYMENKFSELVIHQISSLVEEFYEYPQPVIRVSNDILAEIFRKKGFDVLVDERLNGLDFVIDFKEFKIESKIEEKIRIIKDEIKREIKKLSEI